MWDWKVLASGFRPPRLSDLLATAAILACAALPVRAQDIYALSLPAPLTEIRMSGDEVVAVLGEEAFLVTSCAVPAGICLQTPQKTRVAERAQDGLPDGTVMIADSGDIRRAWYARPTTRYAHGALGDDIEGGSLVVVTTNGRRHEYVLPDSEVFEDLTPRIADLDGDGANEIVTIRSSQTGGAAVAIYAMRDGDLQQIASGPEIGRPNRWLNIAGIAPDGTIFAVLTPHIGGRLVSLTYRDGRLIQSPELATDVTNHVFGSRELGMAAVGDFDGDGKPDLAVPSQDRKRLRFPLSSRPDIELPFAIDKAIIRIGNRLVISTLDGALYVIEP